MAGDHFIKQADIIRKLLIWDGSNIGLMISQEYKNKSNFVCTICKSLKWCLKDWFQSRLTLIGQSQHAGQFSTRC